ncbi:MAG: Cas9 inhibitor AcrIIA9 family protein [Clostridia bacterium]
MIELNLQTKTKEQELVKQYLQENASESLAQKINNGVPKNGDNAVHINKKNLDDFMKYASDEAKKLAESGASSACVEDKTVYGWAVHYFEEDSIIGTLFNLDGSEYNPPKPKYEPKAKVESDTKPPVRKEEKPQPSLFDLYNDFENNEEENAKNTTEDTTELFNKNVKANCEETAEIVRENNTYKCESEPLEEDFDDSELDNAIGGKTILNDGEIIDYADFDGDIEEVVAKAVVPPQKPPEKPKESPIYQKYTSVQKDYPKTIVAIKLGDFYEFFAAGAIAVASELDLTLTGRNFGFESRVPMCGIPYHCIEKYFGKICEQHDLVVIESEQEIRQYPKKVEAQQVNSQAINATETSKQDFEMSRQIGSLTVEINTTTATTSTLLRQNKQLDILFALFGDSLEVR